MNNPNSEDNHLLLPRLPWPTIEWRSEYLLGLIPFLLGLVPIFAPNLTDAFVYQSYRIHVGVILLLSPVIIPFLPWLLKCTMIIYKRATTYSRASNLVEDIYGQLIEIKTNIFDLFQSSPHLSYEIRGASYYKGNIYISVRHDTGFGLSEGDLISVVDLQDAMILGVFKVIQVRSADCYAMASGFVDPVLSGYIRQQQQADMLPHVVAMRFEGGGEEEE